MAQVVEVLPASTVKNNLKKNQTYVKGPLLCNGGGVLGAEGGSTLLCLK
jgi:hypothetical protein